MPILARLNPFSFILRKLSNFAIRQLTKPVAGYSLRIPNDLDALKRSLRKGDVVLIEGNERVSECIKYLTQSSWSHACLYVGDEPLRRDAELKRKLTEQFGDDAQYLVVEALIESGVILSPIGRYREFNMRICRPHGLTAADQREVVDAALAKVGRQYDFKNVFDLTRYFLPVHLVPARFRRRALQFGSGDPTRVICSSLIADCFTKVRFPVLPQYEPFPEGFVPGRGAARLLGRFARNNHHVPGRLRMVSSSLITPRDFDLSPYFAIIKYNVLGNNRFDYHKLSWIEDLEVAEVPPKLEESA
jgi:hypothetical protein